MVSLTSAVIGLILSAQDWARTATGATIILISFAWFILSTAVTRMRRQEQ